MVLAATMSTMGPDAVARSDWLPREIHVTVFGSLGVTPDRTSQLTLWEEENCATFSSELWRCLVT